MAQRAGLARATVCRPPLRGCPAQAGVLGHGALGVGIIEAMGVSVRVVQGDPVVAYRGHQAQEDPGPPRRGVISAGDIPRQAQPADDLGPGIEGQAAAEGNRTADAPAHHRISLRAELAGWPLVRVFWTHRIPRGEPEQRIGGGTGLHPRVQLRGRQGGAIQAQAVSGKRFRCGNLPAERPLREPGQAGERHGTDDAVAIDHNGPVVIIQAGRVGGVCSLQGRLQRLVGHRATARLALVGRGRLSKDADGLHPEREGHEPPDKRYRDKNWSHAHPSIDSVRPRLALLS